MRTRTLLVLAVAVGLLILVAGTIQLLRLDEAGSGTDDLAVGESARAGDLEVTVLSAAEAGSGAMEVRVRVSGVDDPSGFDDFVLLGGAIVEPNAATADDQCRELTVAEQTCVLIYDTSDLQGEARVLRVRRGEDQRRWVLR
jgi:hypothetical protein